MTKKPRLADFYTRHYAKYLAIAILLQIGIALFICGGAWLLYSLAIFQGEILILVAGSAFLIVESIVIVLTLRLYGQPLKIVSDAIAHVSDQASDAPPPNVNKPAYARSGLKALVQTVYELSVASFQAAPNESQAWQNQAILQTIIGQLPCELIILDKQSNITFYHGSGGLVELPSGVLSLSLRFSPKESFEHWLKDCRQGKVRDSNVWKRVPNALLGSTAERKLYDVIAHYEKSDSPQVETVLLLVDRTVDYTRDEDDMDFIALAAHELRGPITVIRGYLDMLNDELGDTLQDDQKELIDRMQVSGERLSSYINNVLNVSKYDRAHLKLHLKEEKIADILRSVADDVALRARTQNRTLIFKVPKDLPTVAADSSSFSEVIVNLIDNAIKYSFDDGEIILRAEVSGDFVQMTVQDFGMGMPDGVVSNLFNKFYRSHRSRQTVGGTGLGLYISKAIMESHGGKIWARSKENRGSTFGVMLPIYATVADKLKASDNGNENIIESSHGWIKNHSMYRG